MGSFGGGAAVAAVAVVVVTFVSDLCTAKPFSCGCGEVIVIAGWEELVMRVLLEVVFALRNPCGSPFRAT